MIHVIFRAASVPKSDRKHAMKGPPTDCWCEPEVVDLGEDKAGELLKLIMHDPSQSVAV